MLVNKEALRLCFLGVPAGLAWDVTLTLEFELLILLRPYNSDCGKESSQQTEGNLTMKSLSKLKKKQLY